MTIKKIIEDFNNELKKTKDMESAFINYLENMIKEFENEIDFSSFLNNMIKEFKITQTICIIKNDKQREKVFTNTLNQYNHNFKEQESEVLKELALFDKQCIINEKKVLYRLTILLNKIFEHLDALKILNNLEEEKDFIKKGIAKTTHPIVKDAITPRLKTFKEYQNFNDSKESNLMVTLYEDFLNQPLDIRVMYQGINIGNPKFIGDERKLVNVILNQQTYLNSATKLEDTHIFKSCQIYCISFYKNNTFISNSLNLKETIKDKSLIEYINTLMDSFFDYEFKSNLNVNHLKKETQLKDTFNNLEILEFRTKRNYKQHPIFKDL
ncbi:hypothetical protein [Arcobacter roscoffensis]|uniref:Uncharacterized protein n=1 Tax=Arcobacter roscoffensis TaxID=2961520 RepID=A0ABY5E829_9BACT|nr:hypothetical protein [Arcobacter roscoffensis]UTJ07881.1 hypothetical protein NJU99_07225 [Arcobacter roscoffensis]